jgi:hypothetical protein
MVDVFLDPKRVFGNEKSIIGSKFVMFKDSPQIVRVISGDVNDDYP